jgi:putative Mg2+ transporter-C (MgtC) family protein
MTIPLTWTDITIRLVLTLVAGALIGLNRGGHGRPAGLRTNILVCLSASLSMILANEILAKAPGLELDPTLRMDVMRLPLGILSGMGFIGAGAILRRGSAVIGVTTAATLWFVTMIGLCFGAGYLALGGATVVLGFVVLWGFKLLEDRMRQEQLATLVVRAADGVPADREIRARLTAGGLWVAAAARSYAAGASCSFTYDVRWHARGGDEVPAVVDEIAHLGGVSELEWQPRV